MSNLAKLAPLRSPASVALDMARREKDRRRRLGITQEQMAVRAGVSLGSLRRFEQTGRASLDVVVRIARVLDCEPEVDRLFSKPAYRSIEEVIREQEREQRKARTHVGGR